MTVMENCENLLLVQAEFDGELDAAEAARAMHHRASCAVCRAAYAEFEAARALLRADAPYHRAPESLRRAIVAGLGEKTPLRARTPAWWRDGASFGLGAAMAAAIALLVIAPAQQDLIDQVVAGHVRALQPGHLEDVVSTDQHTVKPWFDGRLDFAPPVKDLAAKNFPLLGGRLDYLGGREVAALVYGRDKHLIDLFIWPDRDRLTPSSGARQGYNVVHWSGGGMNFWAVSDLEAGELRAFSQQWQAEN
jgi:anti-sigma factor RsiW